MTCVYDNGFDQPIGRGSIVILEVVPPFGGWSQPDD